LVKRTQSIRHPLFSTPRRGQIYCTNALRSPYEPATAADDQTVTAYGNLYDTPPYLIYVKPILKLEGKSVAEGGAVPMTADLSFRMAFTAANGEIQQTINNTLVAGATQAIALDSGYANGRVVTDRTAKLGAAVAVGEQGDSVIGEFLNLFAVTYLQELDSSRKITARTMKLLDTNHQAEAMVGVNLVVRYSFGVPRTVAIGGVEIDVDRNIGTVLSLDGDHTKAKRFVMVDGLTSSALEHDVFEKVLSEPTLAVQAVSAVKALQVANAQGIAIHRIDQTNIGSLLPSLSIDAAIKADIGNAVSTGMTAIVSAQNIQLNDWRGVGYVLLDPNTGAGFYRISGGLSGGSLTMFIKSIADLIKHRRKMDAVEVKRLIEEHRKKVWFPAPANASITSHYGPRKDGFHFGTDFGTFIGEPVYAVADGTVSKSAKSDSYGEVIYINHGFGIVTRYAHNSKRLVNEGDEVKAEKMIAESGNTGTVDPPPTPANPSAGQHLHFEVWFDGKAVNSETFFQMRPWL
jgi:murein DD-endopeptidase MepM/ murein hydrolase activator NlpD